MVVQAARAETFAPLVAEATETIVSQSSAPPTGRIAESVVSVVVAAVIDLVVVESVLVDSEPEDREFRARVRA